ncbi:MAG TPA: GntR family transcriptional regulator [Capillimicrobium sp.]|nr:GntR family transcriptional regulator [Capillimicrobium sp.]
MAEQPATKVDAAEAALRAWLSPGRRRAGDRLPPEHELATQLGVSRGTLRAALARLEAGGEIVRRRGSGTFVGDQRGLPEFKAGLEVLESYATLARRQGLRLTAEELRIEHRPGGPAASAALRLPPDAQALVVERTLVADDVPVAWMRDVVVPAVPLPSDAVIERRLRAGRMLLDLLGEHGTPVAFARTQVQARLVDDAAMARQLGVPVPTAAIELVETMHSRDGTPLQHSVNVFAPGRLSVHVMRSLGGEQPLEELLPPLARRPR